MRALKPSTSRASWRMHAAPVRSARPAPRSSRLRRRSTFGRSQRTVPTSATGSNCVQSARRRWIVCVRSRTKRRRWSSSVAIARTISGSKRGAELRSLAQDDVGDRAGVAWIGLAWPLVTALAVGAPGGDVQNLEAGRGKDGDERAPVAAGALDANDRFVDSVGAQPVDQLLVAGRAVGDRDNADLTTTLIDQGGGMAALVDVDSNDQFGLLARD